MTATPRTNEPVNRTESDDGMNTDMARANSDDRIKRWIKRTHADRGAIEKREGVLAVTRF